MNRFPDSKSSFMLEEKNRGWRSRGYLPHFEGEGIPQSVTIRLAGSIPKALIERWKQEAQGFDKDTRAAESFWRADQWLDHGHGRNWLANPEIASIVQECILFRDGKDYFLHGWAIMPNHAHLLFTPSKSKTLAQLMQSLKAYSARQANKILNRSGRFWQPEYFDRFIRNRQQFTATLKYIEMNPVKARLCKTAGEWPFSSASQ